MHSSLVYIVMDSGIWYFRACGKAGQEMETLYIDWRSYSGARGGLSGLAVLSKKHPHQKIR